MKMGHYHIIKDLPRVETAFVVGKEKALERAKEIAEETGENVTVILSAVTVFPDVPKGLR